MLENRPENQSVLVWLPIGANKNTGEGKKSVECRDASIKLGCHVTKVRWSTGIRTIGCQLIYCLPLLAGRRLRAAVEEVFQLMGWNQTESSIVRIEHFVKQTDLGFDSPLE